MDALPAPRFQRRPFNPRKRRRADSSVGDADSEGKSKHLIKVFTLSICVLRVQTHQGNLIFFSRSDSGGVLPFYTGWQFMFVFGPYLYTIVHISFPYDNF